MSGRKYPGGGGVYEDKRKGKWIADFPLDGDRAQTPHYDTKEEAEGGRDMIVLAHVMDENGNIPDDFEYWAPNPVTPAVKASLRGKSWQEVKQDLHDELEKARTAKTLSGVKNVHCTPKKGNKMQVQARLTHPVTGKRVTPFIELVDDDEEVVAATIKLAAQAIDRQNGRWWGSDTKAPDWNNKAEDIRKDPEEESWMRELAAEKCEGRVTYGECGPWVDRARWKQGGAAAPAADEAGPSTAPRSKAQRRPRAPAAPAPAPAAPAADAESSDDEYEANYDSDLGDPMAAAAAALAHNYTLMSQEAAQRAIDLLREFGITYPFTDDPETSEIPEDPHGVLEHLAGPEWYLPPPAAAQHPEAKALWKSELALAGRKAVSETSRIYEELCMAEEAMWPQDLQINGEWDPHLRRTLIRHRYISEDGTVLCHIPGYRELQKLDEARRKAPPPTPEEAAAEAAWKEKWADLPMSAEEEAELRKVYDALSFDPGLEKYYLPYGQCAVESAVDYGAYLARKETEVARSAAVAEAEDLMGPDGLPDMNKVRKLYLQLGDEFMEAACGDELFRDWAISNMAELRRVLEETDPTFVNPDGAAAAETGGGEGSDDAEPGEETAGKEEEEEEEENELDAALAGGPVGEDDPEAWAALASATAALQKKLGRNRYSEATLAAAAAAAAEVGTAAIGAAPAPAPAPAPAAPVPPPAGDLQAQICARAAKLPQSLFNSAAAAAAAAAPPPAPAAPAPAPAGDLKAQIRAKMAKLPMASLRASAQKRLAELQAEEAAGPSGAAAPPAAAPAPAFTAGAEPSTSSGGKKKGKKKKSRARGTGAAAKSTPAAAPAAAAAMAPAPAPAAAEKQDEEKEEEAPAVVERLPVSVARVAEKGEKEEQAPAAPAAPAPAPVPAASEAVPAPASASKIPPATETEEEKAEEAPAVAAPAPAPAAPAAAEEKAAGAPVATVSASAVAAPGPAVAARALAAPAPAPAAPAPAPISVPVAAEKEQEEAPAPPAAPAGAAAVPAEGEEYPPLSPEFIADFEAHIKTLSDEEILELMGGDLEAMARSTHESLAFYAAAGLPLPPESLEFLESYNPGPPAPQKEPQNEENAAIAAAASAFEISPEEFAERWDGIAPGLSATVADAMAGTGPWKPVDEALAGKLESLTAAFSDLEKAITSADAAGDVALDEGWRAVRSEEWNWKISLARKQGRDGVAWLADLLGPEWPRILGAHPDGDVFGPHRKPPEIYDPLLLMGVYDYHLHTGVTKAQVAEAVFHAAWARLHIWGSRFYDNVWRYWGPVINMPALVNCHPVAYIQATSQAALGPHYVTQDTWGPEDDAFVAERLAKLDRAGKRTRKDTVYL